MSSDGTVKAWINKRQYVEFVSADDTLLFYAMYANRAQFEAAYTELKNEAVPDGRYDELRRPSNADEMKRIQNTAWLYTLSKKGKAYKETTLGAALGRKLHG